MDPAGELLIRILVCGAFGGVVSAIAHHKGRNAVGWFFLGFFFSCIALIIILCLSNLQEEEARWDRMHQEQRRLREQLKQERLKNQAFQGHVHARLQAHDEELKLDTRQLGSIPTPPALSEPVEEDADESEFQDRRWLVSLEGRPRRSLSFQELRRVYRAGMIDEKTLIWTEGMDAEQQIADVPGLLEALI